MTRTSLPTKHPARSRGSAIRLNRVSLPHTDLGVTLINEIAWDSGVRACYFNDPAGNLLEIAARDLWPE